MRLTAPLVVLVAALLSGCAARSGLVLPPAGPGLPFPEAADVHAGLRAACAGVRTFTAELGLSGRLEGERVRGRVVAGFAAPASMRLEGVAPFGPPAFILAAHDAEAVLLLPRDRRVVREGTAAALLGALTGVALAPADLQAILTGCVRPDPQPTIGQRYGDEWASIGLEGGATLYVRREAGGWALRAARLGSWHVEYPPSPGRFPGSVRLRSVNASPAVDLTASLSQLMTNVDIDPAAFVVDVPPEAAPMTLEELSGGGVLRR